MPGRGAARARHRPPGPLLRRRIRPTTRTRRRDRCAGWRSRSPPSRSAPLLAALGIGSASAALGAAGGATLDPGGARCPRLGVDGRRLRRARPRPRPRSGRRGAARRPRACRCRPESLPAPGCSRSPRSSSAGSCGPGIWRSPCSGRWSGPPASTPPLSVVGDGVLGADPAGRRGRGAAAVAIEFTPGAPHRPATPVATGRHRQLSGRLACAAPSAAFAPRLPTDSRGPTTGIRRSSACPRETGTISVLRNLEQRIENLVEGVFSRAFSSQVQPVEIARKLAKEMDAHRTASVSRVYVPNQYTVWLSSRGQEAARGVRALARAGALRVPARARPPPRLRAADPSRGPPGGRRAPAPRRVRDPDQAGEAARAPGRGPGAGGAGPHDGLLACRRRTPSRASAARRRI